SKFHFHQITDQKLPTTMPYYSRADANAVDDFDEHDPTPYGGGYDIHLTFGRPVPHSDETCYPKNRSADDDIDYDRPHFSSQSEPSAYGGAALTTEYSSYIRPKPRPHGSGYGGRTESEYGSGGRTEHGRPHGEGHGSGYGGRTESEYEGGGSEYGRRKEKYGDQEGEGYGRRRESPEHGAGGYGRRRDDDDDDESRSGRRYGHGGGDDEGYGRKKYGDNDSDDDGDEEKKKHRHKHHHNRRSDDDE
ncbi:Uncharacterized protein At5g39570, partial [Linum grandiflorum]